MKYSDINIYTKEKYKMKKIEKIASILFGAAIGFTVMMNGLMLIPYDFEFGTYLVFAMLVSFIALIAGVMAFAITRTIIADVDWIYGGNKKNKARK